ncbi:MAG: glycerate kinase [Pirellulaceae bacterium]
MNLQDDVQDIFQAAVHAVRPERLFCDKISLTDQHLVGSNQAGEPIELVNIETLAQGRKLVVVGAGKAAAQMALALEKTVIQPLQQRLPELSVEGWINCPEGVTTQTKTESGIKLFAARPAGLNSPTEACVYGTEQIVRLLEQTHQEDVVLCLLSGGGSALLTLPIAGLTLEDKQAVAELVAAAGGNIEQLNGVRQCLSQVKGSGLARACNASQLCTLVISDVLGDSLATIASGPTFAETQPSAEFALETLMELRILEHPRLQRVRRALSVQKGADQEAVPELERAVETSQDKAPSRTPAAGVKHLILGSNRDAVVAARHHAEQLGYECFASSAPSSEPAVHLLAEQLATEFLAKATQATRPFCWIHGGEPTVRLPKNAGKGGRNQQLTGEVLKIWCTQFGQPNTTSVKASELAFLSGGTDGEDGPTDAAGAFFGESRSEPNLWRALCPTPESAADQTKARHRLGELETHLAHASTYDFFEEFGGLLKTGPTGTNVCDLRIMIYRPEE